MRILWAALILAAAAPAAAQTFPFERTLDTGRYTTLQADTDDGAVVVSGGGAAHLVVSGIVRVRVGWNVPADAVAIAQRTAASPPIGSTADGLGLTLNRPKDQRAVSIEWHVQVPDAFQVSVTTGSGAITVRGIRGTLRVRTGSGAVKLGRVGPVEIDSQSGAVAIDGLSGGAQVTTGSAGITGRGLAGRTEVHTDSGAVSLAYAGAGDVQVTTASSTITLAHVDGAVTATTQSGRVIVTGRPAEPWSLETGSSAIEITIPHGGFALDAETESGSIKVTPALDGAVDKRSARGAVAGGGPTVRLRSRSGTIKVH